MKTSKWLMRKIKGINRQRMQKTIDIIATNSKKSKPYIYFDLFRNFLTRGIGYTDYFRGNYIELTKDEKKTFVTAKSFHNLLAYLNNPQYEIILHDKLLFNRFFAAYLKRDYLDLTRCSYEEYESFVAKHSTFFAKNPTGEGGHGVSKITTQNKNIKKIYQSLKENNQLLLEEAIIQSDDVNEINPNVVNSWRVVTLYKDGEVTIIGNAFRINQDDSEVIGCTNDLYFSLNEDGTIGTNVIDDYGHIYEEHPLTKKKFKDVKIKNVSEALSMCQKAAQELPQVRYIGWDIAFSKKGPVIVEGNEYPGYGILQFYLLKNSRTGHLKEIADVLKDEMQNIKL